MSTHVDTGGLLLIAGAVAILVWDIRQRMAGARKTGGLATAIILGIIGAVVAFGSSDQPASNNGGVGSAYHAAAICQDGSTSYSQHAEGTCSYHGGVSSWLSHPPP